MTTQDERHDTLTRDEIIAHAVKRYAERRELVDLETISPEAFDNGLHEMLSTRTPYGLLRQAPTFHKRPAGSLMLRLWRWHKSNGSLEAYMMAKWDAEQWSRAYLKGETSLTYLPTTPAWETELDKGGDLFDRMDSSIMIALGGSPAAERWSHALGRVPS